MTRPDPTAVELRRVDGVTATVREVLDTTRTDAFAVAHDGAVVTEAYAEGTDAHRPHSIWSVTKSLVGCVTGVLLGRGLVDEGTPLEDLVPELRSSGYAGATVRHLLDMRSGVRFREDYEDPGSDIGRLDEWITDGRALYDFLPTLEADRPHGGTFLYRSCETDVLGWVCERATGRSMPDLVGEHLWGPLGAQDDIEFIRDRQGTAVHDGGAAATARDLLQFGQLLLAGGVVDDGRGAPREVLPARWMRQAWTVDADIRGAFIASPAELAFPGGWYRNQFWFRPGPVGDVLLGLGIHGQLLYVCRRTRTVCVKLSSWPSAQDPAALVDTLRACDALSASLAGLHPSDDVHRLRGVAGLDRHGDPRPGPHVV